MVYDWAILSAAFNTSCTHMCIKQHIEGLFVSIVNVSIWFGKSSISNVNPAAVSSELNGFESMEKQSLN